MTRIHVQIVLAVVVCMLTCVFSPHAAETNLLKAKVSDIEGRPMEGAKLFLYDSSNVRRPADFISTLSDRTGKLQIALPPGKYWGVARFKADGKYGPLMPGDKHSGEPLEIDLTGSEVEVDFVVADIRELGQKKRASATDALLLKGHVIDSQGAPIAQTFVFANRTDGIHELPEYISAWTGDDGRYELYLPSGSAYYVGVSRKLPVDSRDVLLKPFMVDPGKIDIAMDINLTVQ